MGKTMHTLTVKVLSHDGCQFDGEAASINTPSTGGPLGILPNHTPLITSLVKGDVVIQQIDGSNKTISINGGVLDIKKDGVMILVS